MEVILFICALVSVPLHALAAQKLFGWYLAAWLEVGVPSLPVFVGLAMFVKLFSPLTLDEEYDENEAAKNERLQKKTIAVLLTPLFYLFFGWLIYRLFVA